MFQTVGDAISDMLAVELILASRDWDVETWNKQYTDLPNRQIKIQASSRLHECNNSYIVLGKSLA